MLSKILKSAVILLAITSGCSTGYRKDKASLGADTNCICFENIQNLSFEIKTSKPKKQNITDIIECKGKIISSPDEVAIVTAPIQGIIKKMNVSAGSYVTKGMVIATVENPEIIKMQEEYLVVKSEYEYYKEDFKRQGELNLENATSMKVMQKAQHEFVKAEAGLHALKKRLELIGINADSIESEKLQLSIVIYAPLSGTVSNVTAKTGVFSTLETPICMISGNKHPILQIYTDESAISKIEKDQLVEFSIPSTSDKIYKATISGFEVNNEDSFVTIYAQVQNGKFHIGMPVDAKIFAGYKSTITITKESLIHRNNKTYIIEKTSENCFSITEISEGQVIGNEQEILSKPEKSDHPEYVVSGVQHIFSKYEQQMTAVR